MVMPLRCSLLQNRAMGLVSYTQRQIDLFSEPDNPALMQTLDTLNTKFGRDAVFLWRKELLRIFPRVKLSPQYTTRLKALPKIRC